MSKEMMLIRQGALLVPATEADREVLFGLKVGQHYKAEVKEQSQRSLKHHRLFFALLQLTLDYWQDEAGLLSPSEIKTLKGFANWLDSKSGDSGAVTNAARQYLKKLKQSRASKIEAPQKSIQAILEWVKREVGHVEYLATPAGVIVQTKSINFQSMPQEAFTQFYKEAFSVCWRFVMSRHFESEVEAQRVIDQMVSMG